MHQTHPHHVENLMQPALGGILRALSERDGESDADCQARAGSAWTLIQSFQPRDTIDLLLAGHLIATNELFADSTRDILRGMSDGLKQRTRSSAVAMGRLALAQLAELERRGIQPVRTEAATDQQPVQTAKGPAAEPVKPPPVDGAAEPESAADVADPATVGDPCADQASWVDEPYQEWVEETPAVLAARQAAGTTTATAPTATWDNAADNWTGTAADFVLPQPGYGQPRPVAQAAA